MTEPVSTTLIVSSVAVVGISIFGVPLGLRIDLLAAGFFGSMAAIVLLTPRVEVNGFLGNVMHMTRKLFIALASCVTAAYIAPIISVAIHMPATVLLGIAFIVGASAHSTLSLVISKLQSKIL